MVVVSKSFTWHTTLCGALLAFGLLGGYLVQLVGSQEAPQQQEERPWYEALPAVAMDYKVHIEAGKEDCYYQYVQPGSTFYVSFQVGWGVIRTRGPHLLMTSDLRLSGDPRRRRNGRFCGAQPSR